VFGGFLIPSPLASYQMRLVILFALSVWPISGLQTKSDPYQSRDPEVRLAKQRLLSMDPQLPGIRFRVGDQMTRLVSVDASIKSLEESLGSFQNALSEMAGVIDVPKANNGLAVQMAEARKNILVLSGSLLSRHRQTSALISNMYQNAINLPPKLASSLQGTLDNLVKTYNQQISRQVSALNRQREQAVTDATANIQSLSRSVSQTQTKQISSAMKMIKQITNDRVELLTKSVGLNQKFVEALNVVNTAIAAVKEKSNADLLKIQNIVGNNQKALQDYVNQAGSTWMANFQNVIAKAAQDATQALNQMSTNLSLQFSASKTTATKNLAAVDQAIDKAVSSVNSDLNTATRRLNLSLQNLTQYTNTLVADLQTPVQDIQDQIATAQNLLSSTQQHASLAATDIATQTTASTNDLLARFQNMAKSIQSNPGISALSESVTGAYSAAQSAIQSSQTSAQSKVASLQSQLGDHDNMVGTVSSALADMIDSQNKDFQTQSQVTSAGVLSQLSAASQRLNDLANGVAAKTDTVRANSDAQLADVVGRVMDKINATHSGSGAQIDGIGNQITQNKNQIENLIQASLGGVLSESGSLLGASSGLAGDAAKQAEKIANLTGMLNSQGDFVGKNLAAANSQLNSLRSLGSTAADDFYNSAMGSTGSAVNAFGKQANDAVSGFSEDLKKKLESLALSQSRLTAEQAANHNATSVMEAQLKANLTMANNLLGSIKANSTVTDANTQAYLSQLISQFKSGSSGQVAAMQQSTNANLRQLSADMQRVADNANSDVAKTSAGLLEQLTKYSQFVASQSDGLKGTVTNASSSVGKFQNLVESTVGRIGSLSTGLETFARNATKFIADQLNATDDVLGDAQADVEQTLQQAWDQFNEVQSSVNGSTANKLSAFRQAVNESIVSGDATVKEFTNYINGMVEYEKASAAGRIAVQQGLLNSIIANAMNSTGPGSDNASAELLARLQSVMGTANSAMNASSDSTQKSKLAQQAMINMFGLTTANQVHGLFEKLSQNTDAFGAAVNGSAATAGSQSVRILQSVGLGSKGLVDFASQISTSVGAALTDAQTNYANSESAIAALASKTNDLSNITQSQLTAILQAMASSQSMYSSALDHSKKQNSGNVASLSGVIGDFVTLVNQTLAESDDLISAVDTNYTDATQKLSAKMDTVLGFISREANSIAASADSSSRQLKSLLTSSGPIEDGIRQRLEELAAQQDKFATSVHDQLTGFVSRLSDDNDKISNARLAATNKLYDTLHRASAQFASNAAAWQAQALEKSNGGSSSFIDQSRRVRDMTDSQLVKDVLAHVGKLRRH
jgi:hypothetical protein